MDLKAAVGQQVLPRLAMQLTHRSNVAYCLKTDDSVNYKAILEQVLLTYGNYSTANALSSIIWDFGQRTCLLGCRESRIHNRATKNRSGGLCHS